MFLGKKRKKEITHVARKGNKEKFKKGNLREITLLKKLSGCIVTAVTLIFNVLMYRRVKVGSILFCTVLMLTGF